MESVMMFAVVLSLLVFIVHKDVLHATEREDLLDRLTAKDFVEYKEMQQEPVKFEPVTVSEQDEYWKEIEENKGRY